MKPYIFRGLMLLLISLVTSCQDEFLDIKPDKALLVPTTLPDMQALLDNYNVMNTSPFLGVISCDDIYTTDAGWEGALPVIRAAYRWEKELYNGEAIGDWNNTYQQIFYTNIILDALRVYPAGGQETEQFRQIKGSALFFRALAHFNLAQTFAKTYQSSTANQDFGIPVRTTSNINQIVSRGTLQQTYDQIIVDFKDAASLLTTHVSYKTRPSKQATLGMLARVYLSMRNYEQASAYASACLSINGNLIDYNTLTASASRPIPSPLTIGNEEVLYHTPVAGLTFLIASALTMIDPELYQSYDVNDLRKGIYFRDRGNGVITFKGNYSGSSDVFAGIATDEVYMIRAEAAARMGNVSAALGDLNALLVKRWNKQVMYVPFSTTSPELALQKILTERRKELVYRNLRWSDLKRLNLDPRYAKTLKRVVKGTEYSLPPNDSRYVFAIPNSEISSSAIEQNIR